MSTKRAGFLERMMVHAVRDMRVKRGVAPRQQLRAGAFAGAEVNRLLMDWVSSGMPADDEMRWTLRKLRDRVRDLERNNPTTRQYLRILSTNVIGPTGPKLRARTRDGAGELVRPVNLRIEQAWRRWCSQCSLDGTMNFVTLQRLLIKGAARDGELLVRKWRSVDPGGFGFHLEPIEVDQLDETLNRRAGADGNAISMGVEYDEKGKRVAYHVWSQPGGALVGNHDRTLQRIPADEIIHLFDPERIGQRRGYSWFVSVMSGLKMLGGYTEAELVAARIGAAKMGFFQRKDTGPTGAAMQGDNSDAFVAEANPGTFGVLPDGYELATFSPDHPSSAFASFVKAQLRDTSVGLGATYNGLANDLEGVNYSSIRAGLLVERDVWRTLQYWWNEGLVRPVFEGFVHSAVLNGGLQLDSYDARRYLEADIVSRGWAWVDPLKDTQAGVMAVQHGMESRTALLSEQGKDFEEVLEQLAEEQDLAEQYGVELAPAVPEQSAGATDAADAEEKAAANEDRRVRRGAALAKARRRHVHS